MKYSQEKPPVYERCRELFGADWDRGVVITYGETIHSKHVPTPPIVAHELVHVKQQTIMGKDIWWERYFEDSKFRFEQEVEAYKEQWEFIRATYSRPERRKWKKHIIWCMVNTYGNMCTQAEAEKILGDQ